MLDQPFWKNQSKVLHKAVQEAAIHIHGGFSGWPGRRSQAGGYHRPGRGGRLGRGCGATNHLCRGGTAGGTSGAAGADAARGAGTAGCVAGDGRAHQVLFGGPLAAVDLSLVRHAKNIQKYTNKWGE